MLIRPIINAQLPIFNKYLMKNLNTKQREAAMTIEGPVMAIAGPGTGKTQTLTERIVYMIEEGILPELILCVTFTNAGATAMRERVANKIGRVAADRIKIDTIHGVCHELVQIKSEYFGWHSLQPADQFSVNDVLYKIIDSLPSESPLRRSKGDPYFEAPRMANLFSVMKAEDLTFEQLRDQILTKLELDKSQEEFYYKRKYKDFNAGYFKQTAWDEHEEKYNKTIEAAKYFDRYCNDLLDSGYYEFADMIRWVTNAMEHDRERFLLPLQEKYQYLLVDEAQDCNGSQIKFCTLLMNYWAQNSNIFVVGDHRQSIYSFQGAINALTKFKETFNPKVIVFTENYRSKKVIIDAAINVINNNTEVIGDTNELTERGRFHEDGAAIVYNFENEYSQLASCMTIIHRILKTKNKTVAVLFRKNKSGELLSSLLASENIDFTFSKSENIFDHDLYEIFKCLLEVEIFPDTTSQFQHAKAMLTLYIPNWSLAYDHKGSLAGFFENGFRLFLSEDHSKNFNEDFMNFASSFQALLKRIALVVKSNNLQDVYKRLCLYQSNKVQVPINTPLRKIGRVYIGSVHSAKGLEWDEVIMIDLVESQWEKQRANTQKYKLPFNKIDETIDKEEEERRLFFVAMTRARVKLHLMSYAMSHDGEKNLTPSKFIAETMLPGTGVSDGDGNTQTRSTPTSGARIYELLTNKPVYKIRNNLREKLTESLERFTISPSSLLLYHNNPTEFVLSYLLQIPLRSNSSLVFGNYAHNILQHAGNGLKAKRPFDMVLTESIAKADETLINETFYNLAEGITNTQRQGIQTLCADYLRNIPQSEFMASKMEFSIFGVFIGDTKVKCRVDRICNNNTIIDYKTGSLSETKKKCTGEGPGMGDIKLQLVLNKIIYNASSYMEGHISNLYVDHLHPESGFNRFEISHTEEDILWCKDYIATTDKRIRALDFDLSDSFLSRLIGSI